MGAPRTTFQDPETGRWTRVCCECKQTKDLERDFYRARKLLIGSPTDWGYQCKSCKAAQAARLVATRKADPWIAKKDREKHARWMREWRRRNPGRDRATRQRYVEGVRKDPVRRARLLENARIDYRLRAEGEGRAVVRSLPAQRGPEGLPRLPVAPLVALVERLAADTTVSELAGRLGFHERQYRAWKHEYKYVNFETADRVLTAAGVLWWEVWDEDKYPGLHEERAA